MGVVGGYAFHVATSRTERSPKMGVVGGVNLTKKLHCLKNRTNYFCVLKKPMAKKYEKPEIIENRGNPKKGGSVYMGSVGFVRVCSDSFGFVRTSDGFARIC